MSQNLNEILSIITDPKTTKADIFDLLIEQSNGEILADDVYLLELKKSTLIDQATKILKQCQKFSIVNSSESTNTLNLWDYRTIELINFLYSENSKEFIKKTKLGASYWELDVLKMHEIIGSCDYDRSKNMKFKDSLIQAIVENRNNNLKDLAHVAENQKLSLFHDNVASLYKFTADSNWSYATSGRAFMRAGIHVSLKQSTDLQLLKGNLPYFAIRPAGRRELLEACQKYLNWEIQKDTLYATIESSRKKIFQHITS